MSTKTDVALLALIDPDNRILISRRLLNKPMGGLWEFPGGKIENEEMPEDALIREAKEELSINISKSCIAPLAFSTATYGSKNFLLLLYVCRVWEGNIEIKEVEEIKWVEKKDLRKYVMPKGNDSLVAMIIDYL